MIPVISVVGKTNSGKTTLIEKIIPELKKRGYKVGAIKHDIHQFEIDHQGKDTYRMTQAGADTVVIASSEKIAMIRKVVAAGSYPACVVAADPWSALDKIAEWLFPDVDIVITEGYKKQDKPKIEVNRKEVGNELLCKPEELLCIVSDRKFDIGVRCFGLDEISAITDLIVEKMKMEELEK